MTIRAPVGPRYAEVLTTDALAFLAELHRRFDARLRVSLADDADEDAGPPADAPVADDGDRPSQLAGRHVEIAGPVDRRAVTDPLGSGANITTVDFEDAGSPTWANYLDAQLNLKERCAAAQTSPGSAAVIVRPRAWHAVEEHLTVDGRPVSGALFDFGLYAFHNARAAHAQNAGPYLHLPTLEMRRATPFWDEVFAFAETALGLPAGSIKVTILTA